MGRVRVRLGVCSAEGEDDVVLAAELLQQRPHLRVSPSVTILHLSSQLPPASPSASPRLSDLSL